MVFWITPKSLLLVLALPMALAAGPAQAPSAPLTPSTSDSSAATGTAQAGTAQTGVTKVGEEVSAGTAMGYTGSARHEIRRAGSAYIKVHFSSLRLAAGDFVTVADPTGREVHTYHGDPTRGLAAPGDSDFTRHGPTGFAAMSIDGDAAVVTVHRSGTAALPGLGVRIDRYWRGYSPSEIAANNPGILSVCGTDARRDVVCYQGSHPTEFARSTAVAKLLIGGGGSCTTWRVGNTNRMLTNKHCFSTQAVVAASEVQFNFQCATCGGNNPGPGTKVSGSTLIRTSTGGSGELDYTLFSVNNFATIAPFGTLFLETRAPVNGERIYIPGHGDGTAKRLSIFEDTQGGASCTVRNAAINTWNMSYSCDTSGGNSGSPVLSANHKVLALHHLGGCPNNQGARMHLIYNQISTLIDNGDPVPPGPRFENTANVTISDNTTVHSPITVSGVAGNAPATLSISVNIVHTWRGDLVLSLVAPDGSVYLLEDFPNGDSADNVVKTYPVNASSEVANGTWRLRVQDIANQDVGFIDSWAMQF